MAANATFPSDENDDSPPNFDIFDKNEYADTSDNLDDNEIYLFIDENQNENLSKPKWQAHQPFRSANDDYTLRHENVSLLDSSQLSGHSSRKKCQGKLAAIVELPARR